MEDKYLDQDPVKKDVLQKMEYVFTALFTLEMILKIGSDPDSLTTSLPSGASSIALSSL